MKLHFDLEGPIEEVQLVLAQVGFPVPTSMTLAEQHAAAAEENKVADRLDDTKTKLKELGKP